MVNDAVEIKVRAERRAGEMLKQSELHKGGRPKTPDTMSVVSEPIKLREAGISHKQSSRWQTLADIPEEQFEETIRVSNSADGSAAKGQLFC